MAKKKSGMKETNNIDSISIERNSVLVDDSFPGDHIITKKKTRRSCIEITLFNMLVVSLFVALCYIFISSFIKYIPTIHSDSEIIKSLTDSKVYSIVKLNNGLEAILISDESLKLSAVGLAVNIGRYDTDLPGLAHLSQHMIMQQSTHYNKTEFLNRLARHIGKYYQAFSDELLSFCFEVGNDAFAQSIREFSEMLYDPIIDKEILSNEIALIDSEYFTNQKNNKVLEEHIIHQVSLNDSSYFPNGNKHSFNKYSNDELIHQITEFISNYYTGSNMKLAVLSNLPINKLKGLVIKYFHSFNSTTPAVDSNQNQKQNQKQQLKPKMSRKNMTLGKVVKYTVKYGAYLSFIFYFDKIEEERQSESYLKYIQYLLRDKKKGSLYSLLTISSYITSMTSSYEIIDQTVIKYTIDYFLTYTGEINIYNIAKQTFNFLRMIREAKVDESLFNEIMLINKLRFNFDSFPKDYSKYVKDTAMNMFQFKNDIKQLSMGKHYLSEYNETIIQQYINEFKAENCLILYGSEYNFTSDHIASFVNHWESIDLQWTKEKWYETSFVSSDLTNNVIQLLNNQISFNKAFNIRIPNKFISKINYTTESDSYDTTGNNDASGPIKISNTPHANAWYKLDTTFHAPKVIAYFYIIPPMIRGCDLKDFPLNLMLIQYIKVSIEEELEDIRVSGNSIEAIESENGIVIEIDCYSDLLKPIIESLSNILFKPNLSPIKRDLIVRLVNNYFSYLPMKRGYQNSFDYFKIIVKKQILNHFYIVYPITDFSQEILGINEVFHNMAMTSLFYGNIDQESINSIYNTFLLPNINTTSTALEDQLKVFSENQVMDFLHEHKPFNGSIIVRLNKVFPNDNDNITSNFFQIGVFNDELDIIISLITILWEKQFLTKIRKEIRHSRFVYSNKVLYDNILYFNFVVQGNVDPKESNMIMDKVIGEIYDDMKEIDDDDLYYAKENLINFKLRKDSSLNERAKKVFNEIYSCSFNFNHTEVNRKSLKRFTKERILDEYSRIFIGDVKKISIQRYENGTIPYDDEYYYLNKSIQSIITNQSNIIT